MKNGTFVIEEKLNHEWLNELVSFTWSVDDVPVVKDSNGKKLTVQISNGKLFFYVSKLSPLGKAVFFWDFSALPKQKIICKIQKEQNYVNLSNNVISIKVPDTQKITSQTTIPAPLLGIKQGVQNWIGNGLFYSNNEQTIEKIKFEIIEEGPLWCSYRVSYHSDSAFYNFDFKLQKDSSYIKINEYAQLGYDAFWEFDIFPGLQPNQVAYGHHSTLNKSRIIKLVYDGKQHIGDLQAPDQGFNFFIDDFQALAFMNSKQALSICTIDEGAWTFIPQNPISMLPKAGNKMIFKLPVNCGTRKWIMNLGSALNWSDEFALTDIGKLQRKYETTLNQIKEMVLAWKDIPGSERPHAICLKEDLMRAAELFKTFQPFKRFGEFIDRDAELQIGQYHSGYHYSLNDEQREEPITAWIMNPDEKVARIIKKGLLKGLKDRVDAFLGPMGHRNFDVTAINLGRLLRPFAHIYDLVGDELELTPAEKSYLKASFAFLAYKSNDRNYWNSDAIVLHRDHPKSTHQAAWFPNRESDFCNYNIDTAPHNFHTDLYTGMGSVAAVFPNHPESEKWLEQTIIYIEQELDNWVFKNGAFIESSTYTLAFLYWWVPYFACLKHIKRKNYFLDERFQRMCYALTRLLGPYDKRIKRHSFTVMGDAMYPSVGGNVFAWLSYLGKEDSDFSKAMMNAWNKTGQQLYNMAQMGISLYDDIYIDPYLSANEVEKIGSEHFDSLGIILRSDYGLKDKEVFFFIKCGKIYSHFHYDEGAFFFFANGFPIMDEYGIQYGSGTNADGETVRGSMPQLHNGISFSESPTDREMYNRGKVTKFITNNYADYAVCEYPVHLLHMKEGMSLWGFTGSEAPAGWWRRHIFYLKPHIFCFHDEIETEFNTTLDLNFKADYYDKLSSQVRIYRGRYGNNIPVCLNSSSYSKQRDDSLNMKTKSDGGMFETFTKFTSMDGVSQEVKDNFYNQISWHITSPPDTDYNWALAWTEKKQAISVEPLDNNLPGSRFCIDGKTTVNITTPHLQASFKVENREFIYQGWAGAISECPNGDVEYIQMHGDLIGKPGLPVIKGEGPFKAVISQNVLIISATGSARWLEIYNLDLKSATMNEKDTKPERINNKAYRFTLGNGEHTILVSCQP